MHPRFEDFEYVSNDEDESDSLAWMGNGMIMAQEMNTSTTGYLDLVDKPPVIGKPAVSLPRNDHEDVRGRGLDNFVEPVKVQIRVEN